MPPSRKRKADTDARPACKYGEKCYRKSEEHLKKFRHPKKKVENNRDDNDEKADRSTASPVRERQSNKRCSNEASANEMQGTSHRCELPESPENVQQSIKQKFLVEMPQDFYDFWAFCESLNKHNPEDALQNLLGLHLVGPFDVVAGKLRNGSVKNKDEFLRHWRYFYDPPEMLTVIRGNDQTMYHLGYFRDDPNEMPVFVASNTVTDGCKITKVAGNLFAAVSKEIAKALKECEDDELRAELRKLNGSLVEFAEQKGHSLSESSKKRPKPQAPTFHGAGIVVPVDRKTEVGYRPLPLSDVQLKKMLTNIAACRTDEERESRLNDLQDLVTRVNIANDECDFGMGLEFGINLFCFGEPSLHKTLSMVTTLAYQLLGREAFGRILKAHLNYRVKTADLSVLSSSH